MRWFARTRHPFSQTCYEDQLRERVANLPPQNIQFLLMAANRRLQHVSFNIDPGMHLSQLDRLLANEALMAFDTLDGLLNLYKYEQQTHATVATGKDHISLTTRISVSTELENLWTELIEKRSVQELLLKLAQKIEPTEEARMNPSWWAADKLLVNGHAAKLSAAPFENSVKMLTRFAANPTNEEIVEPLAEFAVDCIKAGLQSRHAEGTRLVADLAAFFANSGAWVVRKKEQTQISFGSAYAQFLTLTAPTRLEYLQGIKNIAATLGNSEAGDRALKMGFMTLTDLSIKRRFTTPITQQEQLLVNELLLTGLRSPSVVMKEWAMTVVYNGLVVREVREFGLNPSAEVIAAALAVSKLPELLEASAEGGTPDFFIKVQNLLGKEGERLAAGGGPIVAGMCGKAAGIR